MGSCGSPDPDTTKRSDRKGLSAKWSVRSLGVSCTTSAAGCWPTRWRTSTIGGDTVVCPTIPQDLKQEFGLAHYEGRGWSGFHHHATLCIAAYGFPVAKRLRHKDTKKRLIRPAICLTRKSHAAGQFDAPSGTFPIRSRHYSGSSLRRWPIAFSDAHAAHRREREIDP